MTTGGAGGPPAPPAPTGIAPASGLAAAAVDELPFRLVGSDGRSHASAMPGTLGGHRRSRIYGRLDCPAALRAIARGGYVTHRVFFADETTARAAGYRPCGVCLRAEHAAWKAG